MQIKLKIYKEGIMEFPLNYNYQFQSAVYSLLKSSPYYSDFIHNSGYGENQQFKLFTFGFPKGQYKIIDKKIYFNESLELEIRSVSEEFCEVLKNSVISKEHIKLFNYLCDIEEMTIHQNKINSTAVKIKTQTPIVIKENTDNGKTIFYSPNQREFYNLINNNFNNKYSAYFGHDSLTNITLLPVDNIKKIVTNYKNIWINAYNGIFELHGSVQAINFLYDTGLGMKNSQGFGLFDII